MKLKTPICTKPLKQTYVEGGESKAKAKTIKKVTITRKKAAEELHEVASCYEKVAYSTVYKKCFYSKQYGCWRYIGKAHDYSF